MPPDRGKILFGVFLFVGLTLFPLALRLARGTGEVKLDASGRPELLKPAGATSCVGPGDWMRANHMNLLGTWRDDYVRTAEQGRVWVARSDSRSYKMSLTSTCLKCHQKVEFCDRCHSFMGETPYCFSCHHVSPTETAAR